MIKRGLMFLDKKLINLFKTNNLNFNNLTYYNQTLLDIYIIYNKRGVKLDIIKYLIEIGEIDMNNIDRHQN